VRRSETREAAAVLGIDRVVFLGHGDSGYRDPDAGLRPGVAAGRPVGPGTLASAHLDGLADEFRRILVEEGATAVTGYDDNGIYGHVDHVLVHRIAALAVEGTGCELYEATLDRSELRRLRRRLVGRGLLPELWSTSLAEQLGVEPGPDLVAVDVSDHLDAKLLAVAAHSSQVVPATSFMGLPAGAFHHLLATEWLRLARPGRGRLLEALLGAPQDAERPGWRADERPVAARPVPA
jgi:LmbE family N-acetylglucosaminyl deacetylase